MPSPTETITGVVEQKHGGGYPWFDVPGLQDVLKGLVGKRVEVYVEIEPETAADLK